MTDFMLNIDLHCHSTISDGVLTPTQLVERAALRGVEILALTDHDDVAGLEEARRTAIERKISHLLMAWKFLLVGGDESCIL